MFLHLGITLKVLAILWASLGGAGGGPAQSLVAVYGGEGPAFPVIEAAAEFERTTGVHVEVVSGSPEEWLSDAAVDADLLFSSAEFMMAKFLTDDTLDTDASTVTALYRRPSAILVRPGNPRKIKDLPDLLKPGTRVMVVTGSGQTGLWEDMAAGAAEPDFAAELRRHITVHAATSTAACALWRERADVDAWITWNIWVKPLRDEATLVEVSPQYRIYRQSSAVLTARGSAKPSAKKFLKYLTSPAGAEIFETWGWSSLAPAPNSR